MLDTGPHVDQARADGLHVEPFVPETAAGLLLRGAIGAIAEGRAEAGPRALGTGPSSRYRARPLTDLVVDARIQEWAHGQELTFTEH